MTSRRSTQFNLAWNCLQATSVPAPICTMAGRTSPTRLLFWFEDKALSGWPGLPVALESSIQVISDQSEYNLFPTKTLSLSLNNGVKCLFQGAGPPPWGLAHPSLEKCQKPSLEKYNFFFKHITQPHSAVVFFFSTWCHWQKELFKTRGA